MPLSSTTRVVVVGAAGQLGTRIVEAFTDADLTPFTRATVDITDGKALRRALAAAAPHVIVNCSAFNDVDGAEDRPLDALAVNAFAVRTLARSATDIGATLVHYSTDFVFDGLATEPYDEQSPPAPRSTYAASKLLGEWFALDAPAAYVLRVESLFGSPVGWGGRRGTLDAMVDRLLAGSDVRAFTDRVVSPSYTVDVAAATRHLVASAAPTGVYHCVNRGQATWYALAQEAARLLGVSPRVTGVTLQDVRLKAERPRFCALSTAKLAATGFHMPAWDDALARWLASRGASSPM